MTYKKKRIDDEITDFEKGRLFDDKGKEKPKNKKQKRKHYCNNKELLSYLIEYKKYPKGSLEYNKYMDKICLAIQSIANNYSLKYNFIRYPFRDDMIADAVYSCIRAIGNFNPNLSKKPNPFSYFTQIVGNAFIARIIKEKEQEYVKKKAMTNYFDMVDYEDDENSAIQENQLQIRESYGIDEEDDGFEYFRRKERESAKRREERKLEPKGIDLIFQDVEKEE